MNPHVIGTRIDLRPLDPADAAVLQPWVNDPDVARNTSLYRPATLQDELEFIRTAGPVRPRFAPDQR